MENQNFNKIILFYLLLGVIYCVLAFVFFCLLFFILERCKLMSLKSFKQTIRIIGCSFVAVLAIWSIPSFMDMCSKSYIIQEQIIECTRRGGTGIFNEMTVYFTDKNGKVIQCYDAVYDTKDIEDKKLAGHIIYAKHSKLLLKYVPD